MLTAALTHLHDLPRHVQDAAGRPAEEAAQAGDRTAPDHTSSDRLSFAVQHPPPLLPFLPLPQLQLPLLLMVAQPHQTLLLPEGGSCVRGLFYWVDAELCDKIGFIRQEDDVKN